MTIKAFTFCFTRHGDSMRAELHVPSSVPVAEQKAYVGNILRQTYPEAHDIVFEVKQAKWTSVETGYSSEYDGLAAGF